MELEGNSLTMETIFILPLSISEWMNDNPIVMLLFAIIWLVLFVMFIKWISKNILLVLKFIITFFLPFNFDFDN